MTAEVSFESAAALRAHYDAIRAKFFQQAPIGFCRKPDPMVIVVDLPATIPQPTLEERCAVLSQDARINTILRHLLDNDPQATVRTIIETVSKVYVVMVQEMLGPRRAQALVDARHAAIVLAYIITKHSLPVIGRAFGGRDHTTVLHAVRKYKHIVDAHRQAEINAQAGDGQEIGL